MNERFRELWHQALAETTITVDKIFGMSASQDRIMERYCELIVLECSEQIISIGRYNTRNGITPDLAFAIVVGLKKHYGVEK